MEDEHDFSIFRFAPSELSHSAFLAWLFQATNSSRVALRSPARVGRLILDAVSPEHRFVWPIKVCTEHRLTGKAGRIDIFLTDNVGRQLAIENKTSAIPCRVQVARYRAALGPGTSVAIVSTAFDIDVRRDLDCAYLGADAILELIKQEAEGHSLLREYATWLEHTLRLRSERVLWATDDEMFRKGLAYAEGQWALMERICGGLEGAQYRAANLGGTPWTQFCFTRADSLHDYLLYRIDALATATCFALKQWQPTPLPSLEAKRARLIELSRWWKEAMEINKASLVLDGGTVRGAKELPIARFDWAQNPPSRIADELPRIHEAFVERLVREGWTVTPTVPS